MDYELEEMRQQMAILKDKLENQTIVNDRFIRRSIKRGVNTINRRYLVIGIIALAMIPYGYWAFVKLNGSSIGVWITMSILMLIVFGYTLYTGRYLRANDLYNSNLIDARQKVAKAKKLDSDWLKFGIPAGLLWIIYFIYDKYQQISDDSFWIFAASMTVACILGVLIGLKIHYRNQDNYQEIVDQIEELTQE